MRRTFRARDYQPDPDQDIKDEIEFHLALKVEELMAEGLSREEAVKEAQRLFGDMERIQGEATREESIPPERQTPKRSEGRASRTERSRTLRSRPESMAGLGVEKRRAGLRSRTTLPPGRATIPPCGTRRMP